MKIIMTKNKRVLTFLAGFIVAVTAGASLAADKQKTNELSLDDVQRFSTAISQIKRYYVKPVTDKELFDDAIRGMLSGLDPHSSYLDENDFKELTETTKGEFGGLGIEVTLDNGVIKVISAIDDTPAKHAGIKSGDYIVRINEKSTKDMTLRDAVNLMRGKKGTKVILTVVRKGNGKPLEVSIVRDIILIKSIKARLFDKNYGYIRVSHFQATTTSDLLKAVNDLKAKTQGNLKGLVLDLRNNPGGLLDSAIEMSDAFIQNRPSDKEELIVYTKGRLANSDFSAKSTPGDIINNAPMVVLINEGSASASEIVAGALKDDHRAVILGTKSFGKGSVQTVLPLGKNRGIKLTTALYYTPSGTSIQAKGITPDVIVEDIKIPKKKKDGEDLLNVSEADLKDHLENGNAKTTTEDSAKNNTKETKADTENSDNLMYEDYQLHEAMILLKGLALTKGTGEKVIIKNPPKTSSSDDHF